MKRIFLIFLLLSITLFAEFKTEKFGFGIIEKSYKNYDCSLIANEGDKDSDNKPYTLLSFPDKPFRIDFKDNFISFKDDKVELALIDNYLYETNSTRIFYAANVYVVLIHDKNILQAFFNAIMDDTFNVFTHEKKHTFNFKKYKNDIIASEFYKKIED